eukprot:5705004-Amphidinium_carterae.1
MARHTTSLSSPRRAWRAKERCGDFRQAAHTRASRQVHPGGSKLIFDCAGKEATALFDPIHPKDSNELLSLSCSPLPSDSPTLKDIMDKLLKPALTMGVVDAATIKARSALGARHGVHCTSVHRARVC